MGKKIYVGNLSFSVTNESLSDKFSEYGVVESAKIILDHDSNRSKGFGFVEMSSSDEASKAIEALDSSEWEGRQMKVSEAKPQAPREGRGGGFNRGSSWR